MNGNLIVSVGGFGAMVVRDLHENHLLGPLDRTLAIDSHETGELARLPRMQQCCIGDVPISKLGRNSMRYPWLNNIHLEVLKHHPANMLNGGSKIRAATQTALQWASQDDNRVDGAIRATLAELRAPEMEAENLRVFIVASVVSTTGSGGCLELGFLVQRILADIGLAGGAIVTLVVVGSEGFDVARDLQCSEAAFFREFQAVAKHMEVPRPHDLVQPSWGQGLPFDFSFYFSRQTCLWMARSIEELAKIIAAWLTYTGLDPDVSAHLDGMRGRHHAQLHAANDITGCPASLSFSGMACFDLGLPSVRAYGMADFGARVADALLGDAAPNLVPFMSQVQLQPGVLRLRLGYQVDYARMDKVVTQLWKTLCERPLGEWPGLARTANLTLGRYLEETREALPGARQDLTAATLTDLARVHRQAAGQVQVQGAEKLLLDVRFQVDKARQEAGDQLARLQTADASGPLDAALRRVRPWNRSLVAEEVRGLLRHPDALQAIYLHEILRLFDDVAAWLDERISETQRLSATLQQVRSDFSQQRALAVPQYEAVAVRFLTRQNAAVRDYDEMLTEIVTPHNVGTLKSALIASESREHDVLALSACSADLISERISAIVKGKRWLDGLQSTSFQVYWERAFPTVAQKKQACEWLLSRSMPLGATVAPGYIGQAGVMPPDLDQVSILVPAEIADEVECLVRAIKRVPAHAIIPRPGYHKLVAVFEEAGYELRAKQHLCRIDAEFAHLSPAAHERLAIAKWAIGLPSYIPHDPFADWDGSGLLTLGLVAGLVDLDTAGISMRHREFGSVTLGDDRLEAERQAGNGYRAELATALTQWLKAQTELKPAFEVARSRWPQREPDLVQLYDKASREWTATRDAL